MRGFSRLRPGFKETAEGGREYFWLFETPVAVTAQQLERVRLGAIKTLQDKLRAMPAFMRERRREGLALLDALERRRIRNRVVGADGSSNGDIVCFEASDRSDMPGRPIISIPGN